MWFLAGPVVPSYPPVRVTDLCFFTIFLCSASIIGIMKARPRATFFDVIGTCEIVLIVAIAVVLGFWYYPEARPGPGQPYIRFEDRALTLSAIFSFGAFVCSLLVQVGLTKRRTIASRKPEQQAAAAGGRP